MPTYLVDAMGDVAVILVTVLGTMLVVAAAYVILRHLGRRSTLVGSLVQRAHRPTQALAVVVALQATVPRSIGGAWQEPVTSVLAVAIVAAAAWLVIVLLLVLEDAALGRFRVDVADNLNARRVQTQIRVVRRVAAAAVGVLAVGAMLMTFPQARTAGASVLASAGLVGVVAALAAQSTLGNVFAGLQLAFGDALRLDDVVVVEGQWGRVEEITLSNVVVRIWDERRLILPTSYFTTTPFQSWTKTTSSVLGTIDLDVDWSVSIEKMRAELSDIVENSQLWDGRVCNLQVTDATGGLVRVRALISAADGSTQWDLRCYVRERLVIWVQDQHPTARPRSRTEILNLPSPAGADVTGPLAERIPAPREETGRDASR